MLNHLSRKRHCQGAVLRCCSSPSPAGKVAMRRGKHGAYAQPRLRHNTAELGELRLQDSQEEEEPQNTDDNSVLSEITRKLQQSHR